jgi:hypothetical protein
MQAEWWDPMTGQIAPALMSAGREGMTALSLNLEPYGSRFLVFSKRAGPAPAVTKIAELPPMDLSTGWRVAFGSAGSSIKMETLRSWIDDESTRYFSGVAVYERNFSVSGSMLQTGLALRLDFGTGTASAEISGRSNGMQSWLDAPVREAAVVYVNDRRAGSVWCPPFSVDVTELLRRGENSLKLQVANTAINFMAGRSRPDYRLLNLRYGTRFEPQDMDRIQPVASGLLGPIRLIAGPAGSF